MSCAHVCFLRIRSWCFNTSMMPQTRYGKSIQGWRLTFGRKSTWSICITYILNMLNDWKSENFKLLSMICIDCIDIIAYIQGYFCPDSNYLVCSILFDLVSRILTLPETNSKSSGNHAKKTQKETIVFQPSIFRCFKQAHKKDASIHKNRFCCCFLFSEVTSFSSDVGEVPGSCSCLMRINRWSQVFFSVVDEASQFTQLLVGDWDWWF